MSHVWTNRLTILGQLSAVKDLRPRFFDGNRPAFDRIMSPPWDSSAPSGSITLFGRIIISTEFITEWRPAYAIAEALSEPIPDCLLLFDDGSEDSSVVGAYSIQAASQRISPITPSSDSSALLSRLPLRDLKAKAHD